MTTDLATVTHTGGLMSPQDLRNQVNAIQSAMREVMKEETHYGKIPGTAKKSLYKAGSEVLLTMFHIGVEPIVEDLSDGDHIRYRVRVRGIHQPTGTVLGEGIGEASTAEEKYAWRRAVCHEEFEATDPTRRRIKWSEWQGKVTQVQQVRTNPADQANTVLKMAKKRGQIDLTLTATAASDIFTQDMGNDPDETGGASGEGRKTVAKPSARAAGKRSAGGAAAGSQADAQTGTGASAGSGDATAADTTTPATAGQVAYVVKHLSGEQGGPTLAECLAHFQLTALDGITLAQWKAIRLWIANPAAAAETAPAAA